MMASISLSEESESLSDSADNATLTAESSESDSSDVTVCSIKRGVGQKPRMAINYQFWFVVDRVENIA